jgi:hypothetical protein
VSEGALMNMFIRSHPRFKIEAEKAKAALVITHPRLLSWDLVARAQARPEL